MQSFDFMIKLIEETINENLLNDDLKKKMNIEFLNKGLSTRVIDALFSGDLALDSVDEIYQIAIMTSLYEFFNEKKFNPEQFFSETMLANYLTFTSINTEEKIDIIELNGFVHNEVDNDYIGYITYEQLYNYTKQALITYNFLSQREAKVKKLSTGAMVKTISINKLSVREISDLILRNKFYNTTIVLNVPLVKGKKSNFSFEKKMDDYGTIRIKPDLDVKSETFTRCDITDGYHRDLGIILALDTEKKMELLKKKIPVQITRLTVENAGEMTAQTFKTNKLSDNQFIKSREKNDNSKFAEDLIKNSYLKDKVVGLTYDEMLAEGGSTYKLLITESIGKNNIDTSDEGNNLFLIEDISKKINTIYSFIEKCGNDTLQAHRNDCNMPFVLITISYLLKDKDFGMTNYLGLIDRLNTISEENFKELKMNVKNVNLNVLYKFISQLMEGVV